MRGGNRCTAQVHPDDAARLGLTDGALVTVRSRTGQLTVPVEITDAVRPGVVSIPHGWGHDVDGTRAAVARAHAGVNSNVLADELLLDVLSRHRGAERHPGRGQRGLLGWASKEANDV